MNQPLRDDSPDPLALAAWAEGRVNETERADAEALLAGRPELLGAVLAGIAATKVPDRPDADTLRAVRALIAAHDPRPAARAVRYPVGSAVAAALILMVAAGGGFDLGRDIASWQSGRETAAAEQVLGSLLASPHTVLIPGQP